MTSLTLPAGPYGLIYADPPWPYSDRGFGKRAGGALSGAYHPEAGRYACMTLGEIASLPVADVAAKDCALALWATSPNLPMAFQVMRSWGFTYKTVAFCWSKITSTGKQVANLGQWTLGNVELCLLGTRGSPKRLRRDVRQLVVAERIGHSAKPPEVRSRLEAVFGDVPRLEMFARGSVAGWDVWGDEAVGLV